MRIPPSGRGVIADISTTYARDSADVTDRQNIQLHRVACQPRAVARTFWMAATIPG